MSLMTLLLVLIGSWLGGSKGIMKSFSTHPPTEERIARLQRIAMGQA